jgi:hypothetical protein
MFVLHAPTGDLPTNRGTSSSRISRSRRSGPPPHLSLAEHALPFQQMARPQMRWLVACGAAVTSALEVAFPLELGHRRVERLAQAAEQVGELRLVDDERRTNRHAIANVAD